MYLQRINTKQKGKVYPSIVLCRSYREKGKQKREIIATLTKWPEHLIAGLEKLIKGQTAFSLDELNSNQGKSIGALWMLHELAKRVGLGKALGHSEHGKLALLQILARCIYPSSRLHISNFWPEHYAIEDVLKIKERFNEDNLYNNLDWLAARQDKIEKSLFDHKFGNKRISEIYLYDVTSSYFEGTQNELSAFGYNRDKKEGKKQIVIGLLCDDEGDPLSVEVFKGNTSDLSTFSAQLAKLQDQFGVERVVIVGDKGMIKSKQIDQVTQLEWNYITSITKAQIYSLIKKEVIQMELFDTDPVEVEDQGVRYILRRNPERSDQIKAIRRQKIDKLNKCLEKENERLNAHPKASAEKAKEKLLVKIRKFRLDKVLLVDAQERTLALTTDEQALKHTELLDGCYVIKTQLDKNEAATKTIHDRYKDLSKVEHAFRTIKTGLEEIRPIYLRKEKRTRAHVFICMLAYKLIHRLKTELDQLNLATTKEIIKSMDAIHYTQYEFEEQTLKVLPNKYNLLQTQIIEALNLNLPTKLYAK